MHQKVVPGDKVKNKASFHNALVDLVNKKEVAPKPQALPKDLYFDGCFSAMTGDSEAAIIDPFEIVTLKGDTSPPPVSTDALAWCLKNPPIAIVEKLTAPYTQPSYHHNTSPIIGVTQEPLRPGQYPGKVRLLGSTWVKLSNDQYTDIVTYGSTHLTFIPGQGVRGAKRGPIRIIEACLLNSQKYAKAFLTDYTVNTILAISHITTGIPAQVGTTPGYANCELVWLHPQTKEWTPLGINRTIYNIAETAVAAGVRIQAKVESYSGEFVVDYEECPGVES